MFEEVGGSKKKKWLIIGLGAGVIALFLLIRNAMSSAATQQAAQVSTDPTATTAAATDPSIVDTGYPSDMTSGVSGTGMDQTLATYLAIADQNTAAQIAPLNKQLSDIQSHLNEPAAAPIPLAPVTKVNQPSTTTTTTTTSHPAPTSHTYTLAKGQTISQYAVQAYGKSGAYSGGGIAAIEKASGISPSATHHLAIGTKIVVPTKP